MHELPQALPFLQFFAFAAFSEGAAAVTGASDFAGSLAVASGSAILEVVESMWQTSAFEMQLLPQGLPFLQFLASAVALITESPRAIDKTTRRV